MRGVKTARVNKSG
jgi:uncharacterized protein YkwD